MSNAIKMKKDNNKKATPKISQSIPVHFYANYIPPNAPRIKPKAAPANLPDLPVLPGSSQKASGIDIGKTGSYSLRNSKHPMSMPVRQGLAGPPMKTPFNIKPLTSNDSDSNQQIIDENKEEPNSLEQKNKGLTVGSFTCFDVMNSPLKQLPEGTDPKDNASATSASTFASNKFEDDVAPEPDEDDEDADNFDMEL